MSISPNQIAQQVVESILAQKLSPGERLGEQELADLFGVSRTLVREALMQLQARGFVEVRPRRGWYVVEPSVDDARDAFSARRIIESGILADAGRPLQSVTPRLRAHIQPIAFDALLRTLGIAGRQRRSRRGQAGSSWRVGDRGRRRADIRRGVFRPDLGLAGRRAAAGSAV